MYYETFVKLCAMKGVKPATVSRETGISTATLTSWKQGKYTPKPEKLKKIADYFGVSVDYLMTGKEVTKPSGYYIDEEAREYAQFLFENPEYRVAFDALRKVRKDSLDVVKEVMDRFT